MVVDELGGLSSDDVKSSDCAQILHDVFTKLSHKTAAESVIPNGQTFQNRVKSLVTLMDRQDFSPTLGLDGNTVELKLMNCPFRSVAMKNPSICSYDFHLISKMLVVDISRIESIRDGAGGCAYRIMATESEIRELAAVGSN